MSRKTKDRQAKLERRADSGYPKSRTDITERQAFHASKYIPAGKHRTVPVGNW